MVTAPAWIVDPSCWPLCYGSLNNSGSSRIPEDAEVEAFGDALMVQVRRGTPFAIVVDTRYVRSVITARQRAWFAKAMQANGAAVSASCVGIAVVVSSSMVRGTLTAVLWLLPTPCPIKAWSDVDSALDWLTKQLETRGHGVPAPARTGIVELFGRADRAARPPGR